MLHFQCYLVSYIQPTDIKPEETGMIFKNNTYFICMDYTQCMMIFLWIVIAFLSTACSGVDPETSELTNKYGEELQSVHIDFKHSLRVACSDEDVTLIKEVTSQEYLSYLLPSLAKYGCTGQGAQALSEVVEFKVISYSESIAEVVIHERLLEDMPFSSIDSGTTRPWEYTFVKEGGEWKVRRASLVNFRE